MRFIVYGAGAVGGVFGGRLALQNHDVLLICRPAHALAITEQKGLRMKSATGEYFAGVTARSAVNVGDFDDDSCVLFTPKSNDTQAGVEALSTVAPPDIPVVSFQNGVTNEEILAGSFTNVFGGICRMTCSFLQPGQVSYRRLGRVIVGSYPKGAHRFARKLGKALGEAGFEAAVSNTIQCDKWLKLVVNLQSAFHAIVDTRDHDSIDFINLKVGVLEEAKSVLRAEKIKTKSCDGHDFSIDEMIADLRKPRAQRSTSGMRVNNSMWQNLYLKRGELECGFFHGPVIEMARRHAIDVPFNEVVLEATTECVENATGPNALRAADLLRSIHARGEAS